MAPFLRNHKLSLFFTYKIPKLFNLKYYDCQWCQPATPSPTTSPGPRSSPPISQPATHVQEPPLYGPPRLDEVEDNSTQTDTLVNYLFRTVPQKMSITEEQNRRFANLERSKSQPSPLHHDPSPTRNRRGMSPRPSRF